VDFADAGVDLLVLLAVAGVVLGGDDEEGRRGAVGATSLAEGLAGGDVGVGDLLVLAEGGKVSDDVHRGDIGGEKDDTLGALADGLSAFWDTTTNLLFGDGFLDQLKGSVSQLSGDHRIGDGALEGEFFFLTANFGVLNLDFLFLLLGLLLLLHLLDLDVGHLEISINMFFTA